MNDVLANLLSFISTEANRRFQKYDGWVLNVYTVKKNSYIGIKVYILQQ